MGAAIRGLMADTADAFSDCAATFGPPAPSAPFGGLSALEPGGTLDLRVEELAAAGQSSLYLENVTGDGIQGAIRPGTKINAGASLVVSSSWKEGVRLRVALSAPLGITIPAGQVVTFEEVAATFTVRAEILSSESYPATPEAQDIAWGVSVARQLLPTIPEKGWTAQRVDDEGATTRTSSVAVVENKDTDVFIYAGREVTQ